MAGPHVRAACKRHLDDLKHGSKRGLAFDYAAADRVYRFFETILKLAGGQFEGKPFKLHASQAFVLGSLFGWKKKDGFRRFRRAYIEQAKGNGKTPLAAGIGIYGMIADGEARAEIYAVASKLDQAKVLYRDARAMVQLSPELARACVISGGDNTPNIAFLRGGSFLRPISSESNQSGPRPHIALGDELHEHKNRDAIEMLERGFKSRQQPMLVMITNSGFDKESVCWEEHEHAVKVAHGDVLDDSTFSFVCSLDEGDDPLNDASCWIKANPLLGSLLTHDYIAQIVEQAKAIPGKRNNILRLHFCVWTDAESVWMAREAWEKCEVSEIEPPGERACYGGLDLSAKQDLTALARVWRNEEDDCFDAELTFWTPEQTIAKREEIDRVPYRAWRDEGYLRTTPSATVNYGFVAQDLAQMDAQSEFMAIAYDRWRISDLENALDEIGVHLPLQPHGQGFKDMAPAIDATEEMILNGKLRVKFNPVLRWNVASAVLEEDPAGNRKFTKRKATGRIDGVVALAMALLIATRDNAASLDDFINDPLRL